MGRKIYTKGGDKGGTSLLSGTRVPKNHERLEIYGTLDELNSWLGLIVSHLEKEEVLVQEKEFLLRVQNTLFHLGSLLACEQEFHTKYNLRGPKLEEITEMENRIDKMTAEVGELRNFILPGGGVGAGYVHVARTICRRFERHLVCFADQQQGSLPPEVLSYTNRLSDYLFTLARLLNKTEGTPEKLWDKTI